MKLTFKSLPCSYDGTMRYALSRTLRDNGAAHTHGTVLILVGWGEWIEKYDECIGQWHMRGYDVVIVEWRGQGLSSRFLMDTKKTWLPSFDILIEDLERLFRAELLQDKNILLFCHSMGAHLGLRWYLARGRKYPAIKGVILASMLHDFKSEIPPCIARALIYGAAWLGFDQAYAIDQKDFDQTMGRFETNPLTHDEAHYTKMMAQLNATPEMKVGGITYGWLHAFLESVKRLEHDLARGAPRIPYMMMGPVDDPLVATAGFTRVAAMLPNCKLHLIDGAKHELLQEKDAFRSQAWANVDQFINDNNPSS